MRLDISPVNLAVQRIEKDRKFNRFSHCMKNRLAHSRPLGKARTVVKSAILRNSWRRNWLPSQIRAVLAVRARTRTKAPNPPFSMQLRGMHPSALLAEFFLARGLAAQASHMKSFMAKVDVTDASSRDPDRPAREFQLQNRPITKPSAQAAGT